MRRGQVLVLVVIGLVVLLAFVGLAMDSSRVYQTRRLLQNAADSAAVAGALELATNWTNTTQASIWDKIAQYLQANGAEPSNARAWLVRDDIRVVEISQSTSSAPPPSGVNKVEVSAARVIPVLFANFLGQSQSAISARACALVGNLRSLGPRNNVVPIAVHYEVVRDAREGDTLILWDGYQVTVRLPNDFEFNYGDTGNPYSGWLNLAWIHNRDEAVIGYREFDESHSQANVNDWIMNGNPYPIFAGRLSVPPSPPSTDGDFIMGDPGIRTSGLHTLKFKCQQLIAQGKRPVFFFIVFDRFFNRDGMRQLFPYHSGEIPASHGDCDFPNSLYFHAVGFVAIEVTEVKTSGSSWKGKYVKGIFLNFVQTGEVGVGNNFTGDDEMVKAVALVE
ncbi:MAG: pilus assembly protein TadG-related protein [Armatimonadetes bacterium]|nr:pilus assembly protein TadG-related protein [Armatimonadota bacterium]MCX7968355.1 pilus assembly protein TadG-related protein [Armatimonadota bacterium]MDW8142834.1 pilus assembly protein TadG-related protein [Armatimonadota bacterium]